MSVARTLRTYGALTAVFTAALTAVSTVGAHGAPPATSSAFTVSATGLVTIEPIPAVNDNAGPQHKSVATLASPDRTVTARTLNAAVAQGNATGSVAELNVSAHDARLSAARVTATAVRAECTNGAGTASLVDATVAGHPVAAAPAPNTEITVPGGASVVLNKQTTQPDGSLTVTAINVEVPGTQSIDIASATCAAKAHSIPTPPPAPPQPTLPPTEAPQPTPVPGHLPVTG